MNNDYARAIRMARAARGITQQELARRAGLDPSYVSLLENAARVPRIDRLGQIAAALEMPLHLLVLLGAPREEVTGTNSEGLTHELGQHLLALFADAEPKTT